MAKLSTEQREKMPAKEFAGPGRSYPINDPKHARAALMLINEGGLSPQQKEHVRQMAHAMLNRGMSK
jgi:hypothetical protein